MKHELGQRDMDYLASIVDHCDRIDNAMFRFGRSLENCLMDADYRDVIMMNIFQIGEAANQLSDICKESIKEIPWHNIIGLRNRIAHAYLKIDDEIVWDTAVNDVPILNRKLKEIIEE